MKHYDVFVIGSGVAGQTAAKICIKNGLSVAIADNREFGGVCSQRGCDPKKVLLQFADIMQHCKNLEEKGIRNLPRIDWETVQSFKKTFTEPVPKKTEENLTDLGIELYHQSPKFIAPNEVIVEGKKVTAEKFIIATGNVPRPLKIEGNEHTITSEDILNLKELPDSVVFLGSGYVAMEFAYMMAVMGTKVTILEISNKALSNFDQFLVEKIMEKMKSLGVDFVFDADTQSIEMLRTNYRISYKRKEQSYSLKAKMVVNATGRIPSVSELDLEKGNINHGDKGVEVNKYLQSKSNKNVYSCGDVSSLSLPLTPLSGLQGYIVGNNVVKEGSKEFDVPCIPSVVFTYPQLASVGMSEEIAKNNYKSVKVLKGDVPYWFNAKKEGEDTYAYKIVVNERTAEILGAHLLSPQANENINIFAMAIFNNVTVDEFKKVIFTYPSFGQDLKSMLADADPL